MRIRLFTIIAIVLLAITGSVAYTFINANAQGKKLSPQEVANQFLEAMANNNFDKMRALSTSDTEELINTFESYYEPGTPPSTKEKASNCKETEKDVCVCDTCCDSAGETGTITLFKVDGYWLVNMEK